MYAAIQKNVPCIYHQLKSLTLACAIILIIGCQPFKPESRTLVQEVPRHYSLYTGAADPENRWWETFDEPELNHLVETALEGNLTLKASWARLRQAQALALQAGSDRYPDLNGSAGYLKGRQRSRSGGEREIEDAGLSLVSGYEVDLWGRVRAEHREAILREHASRQDLNAAAMTIAAEVARRWVGIISQRMQRKLLEDQLGINETLLELVNLRFKNAMVSVLDVYQQKQLVDNVLAEIPLVEQQEQLLMNQLAMLLGKPPHTAMKIDRQQLPEPKPVPPTGLPADLLSARPDVQAAGLRLEAADWQIAQARANRLPALSLTASASYGDGDLDLLFDNWLVSLAANLAMPIIDGGWRRAEVDRTIAVADENLAAYREVVLTAVKEVEDALAQENKQREHIQRLRQVADTAKRALEEAGIRYRNGLNDYLPVLTQLLSVQNLERDIIIQQANLLTIRISLFRALGGSWPDELEMPQS